MNYKFISWYSLALGGVFGIIACLLGYLNGYMYVYSNISKNIKFLSFSGTISSYLLYPLCFFIMLLALIMSIPKYNITSKNAKLKYLNLYAILITNIIGFMGTRLYFCMAALFMSISLIFTLKKVKDDLDIDAKDCIDDLTKKQQNESLND